MASTTRDEVRIHVDAPPSIVYSLVSDVTRMAEWPRDLRLRMGPRRHRSRGGKS